MCAYCAAGNCECLGGKNDRYRKCSRIPKVVFLFVDLGIPLDMNPPSESLTQIHFCKNMLIGSGYIDLPYYLPFLGTTQFQILCILAPVLLVITMLITCITIKEVDPALLFLLPGEHSEKGIQAAINVSPPAISPSLSSPSAFSHSLVGNV